MAHYRAFTGADASCWQLRALPVCSSTERQLEGWLKGLPSGPITRSYAVFAAHQTRAIGQRGRVWSAPRGGVWVSAALPWSQEVGQSAGLAGLALAVAMAEQLERAGVPVRIKWPNDLLVDGAKLAGLLPRLVYRGSTLRLVRFGLGLNVRNAVPAMATSLRRLQGPAAGSPAGWAAQVMVAMDRCLAWARADQLSRCLSAAEARLWSDVWIDPRDGQVWSIEGLSPDGGLCLRRGATRRCLQRWG
ncbi:MAG: biotin--[acetyl-CoA-carboxylase] ligase [Synechococcus sp.]